MLRYLSPLILLFVFPLSCQPGVNQEQQPDFSGAQLLEEIESLRADLVAKHPGLLWYQTAENFESNYQMLRQAVKNGMNGSNYYRLISEFITNIGCGHTRVRPPRSLSEVVNQEKCLPPFTTLVTENKLFIDLTTDSQLTGGEEIISINGIAANKVLAIMRARVSGDGYNLTGKDYIISNSWPLLYARLLDETVKEFSLVLKSADNQTREVKVGATNLINLTEKLEKYRPANMAILKVDEESSTAIVDIRTFGQSRLQGVDYIGFLRDSFHQLREKSIQNLILDLRGNGGGRDEYGALLVSYLSPEPFGYFKSIEVTKGYSGYGTIEESGGKRLMTTHSGLAEQEPALNYFQGDIYMLIDGGCFSTCADVASVVRFNNLATHIIGQETGGGATGNTSGSSYTFRGTHTGVSVSIPKWKYTTANIPQTESGKGVAADITLPTSFRYTESDEILDYVKNLIANK